MPSGRELRVINSIPKPPAGGCDAQVTCRIPVPGSGDVIAIIPCRNNRFGVCEWRYQERINGATVIKIDGDCAVDAQAIPANPPGLPPGGNPPKP